MPANVTYPLDLSGVSPANLVTGELHSVNEAHYRDYYFLIPTFCPFFVDNFSATMTLGSVSRPLVEDVDFSFALSYVTGTRVTGKAMYGGLTLHNLDVNGIISITYQTVGGDQIADRLSVLTLLADKAYNPRTTVWDLLIADTVPNAFPPTPHYQDYDNFYGQQEVVDKLGEIRDAILNNSSLTSAKIEEFLTLINGSTLSNYISRLGDTMTGPLTLSSDPVTPMQSVTKRYVDNNYVNNSALNSELASYYTINDVDTALGNKVSKSGDTMTGPLELNADPTLDAQAATKRYVDAEIGELQTVVNALSDAVGGVAADQATKTYVDSRIDEVLAIMAQYQR